MFKYIEIISSNPCRNFEATHFFSALNHFRGFTVDHMTVDLCLCVYLHI